MNSSSEERPIISGEPLRAHKIISCSLKSTHRPQVPRTIRRTVASAFIGVFPFWSSIEMKWQNTSESVSEESVIPLRVSRLRN